MCRGHRGKTKCIPMGNERDYSLVLSGMKKFRFHGNCPFGVEIVEKMRKAACHYCTAGCPKQIPIPEIFAARNKQLVWEQLEEGKKDYAQVTADAGTAAGCRLE